VSAAVLYREWSAHRDTGLHYSERDGWDRMLQSGVQLLDRFAQDDRIRIRQPRRNLQIQYTRPLAGQNNFLAYVDAVGELDGTRCLLEWKTTGPLSGRNLPDCWLSILSWFAIPGSSGWQTSRRSCLSVSGWSRFSASKPYQRRATRRVRPPRAGLNPTNRSS
jgi:hypothetical protein